MIAPTRPAASLAELVGLLGRTASLIEQQALGRAVAREESPTRQDLLRTFLSDGERAILRELIARAPGRAGDVQNAVRSQVSKSAFWVLWKGLQVRGLVDEGHDGLFRPAAPWLAALIGVPDPAAAG
jgi:hypothetical protein